MFSGRLARYQSMRAVGTPDVMCTCPARKARSSVSKLIGKNSMPFSFTLSASR